MNINITKLLQQGEGLTVEFKRAKDKLPETLFDTICAFLNRNGGTVLLGVLDNGIINGVDPANAERMLKEIITTSNDPHKLFPSFLLDAKIVEYEHKTLIHIFVPMSSQVHRCKSKVFDRGADGDFELKTDAQIRACYTRKNNEYSENTIYLYLYESDFADGVVERVRRIIRINRPDHPWNELSNNDFFRVAGLFRRDLANNNEGFTMAALLLFGKEEVIRSAIPHYKVDALFRKIDIDRYDDRENIRCNLVEAYDKLMAFVAKHLPDKFYLQGEQRISLREKIFREVIANMLIHREYTNAYPSTLTIYRNKVETKNANRPHLYGQLLPDNFEPFPKNPHIAQIFTQMGRTEELGTGIRNVFKYSQFYSGNNHIVFKEEDVFISIVPLEENTKSDDSVNAIFVDTVPDMVHDTVPDTVPDTVHDMVHDTVHDMVPDTVHDTVHDMVPDITDNQKAIIKFILENDQISMIELSVKVGISKRKILDNINKLRKMKMVDREGNNKKGFWIIKKLQTEKFRTDL